MRFKLYLIITVSLLVVFTSCNNGDKGSLSTDVVNNPETASGKNQNSLLPVIEFEKVVHDFGNVIQGEKVSFGFKFKNTGNSDLVISQVNSSCGCTVPTFPTTAVKPGEGKVITVTFDSKGRKGIQNKTVTIASNCQPNRNIIRIKASVIEP